ncbi:MAG: VOC family protein [Cyclobacteriaceae bacterium]|nr:VOC family protein [Cyclobacteriaceae bacterium]
MKLRLHEIEYGSGDVAESKSFYSNVLGLETSVDQPALKVYRTNVNAMDLNFSEHIPKGVISISFLTNDLDIATKELTRKKATFTGPEKSHLGMMSITLHDPNGIVVKINTPTSASPQWLKDLASGLEENS